MVRTLNVAEHCVFADLPKVITVGAAAAVEVLPNEQGVNTGEIAYRYIQNIGANDVYYSFGLDDGTPTKSPVCDATTNFHGLLKSYVQLDCSNHRLRVCVYSPAGTTIATTIIRRKDLTN